MRRPESCSRDPIARSTRPVHALLPHCTPYSHAGVEREGHAARRRDFFWRLFAATLGLDARSCLIIKGRYTVRLEIGLGRGELCLGRRNLGQDGGYVPPVATARSGAGTLPRVTV